MKKKSKSIITNSSFQYKTPLRTDHSSDKINYISWRKTCLRKCVDYKCGIASTADSPESANENDHFDEIRNFMHKVTPAGVTKFGGAGMRNMFRAEDMSSVINPDEKEKGGDGLESECTILVLLEEITLRKSGVIVVHFPCFSFIKNLKSRFVC